MKSFMEQYVKTALGGGNLVELLKKMAIGINDAPISIWLIIYKYRPRLLYS